MLRYIRDLLGWNGSTSDQLKNQGGVDTTVVYLRVSMNPSGPESDSADQKHAAVISRPEAANRSSGESRFSPRPLRIANDCDTGSAKADQSRSRQTRTSKSIRSLGLFSDTDADRLESLGLHTAGDLVACDPQALAAREAPLARRIRLAQRALRFSRRFPDMMPTDALLLFAVHRRSRKTIAGEPPGLIRRDIQRLLLSSRGQKRWGDRTAPPIALVKAWVDAARLS